MNALDGLKYPLSSPFHPTSRELGHARPWVVRVCKFCGHQMETRAVCGFKCKKCNRMNWINKRR